MIPYFINAYLTFAEKSPDGIVVRQDRKILYVNSSVIKRMGYSKEQFRQMDAFSLVSADDLEAARELAVRQDSGQDTPKFVKLGIKDKNGAVFTCEVASSAIEYLGQSAVQHTFRDVSYRENIQKELRLQANLLSNVNDCIIVADGDYDIIFWNQGAKKLLGWESAETSGKKLWSILGEELFHSCIKDTLITDRVWKGQIDVKTREGDLKSIQLSVSIITDDWNQTNIVVIASDVTELLASQRREYAANQAKSEFMAHLSHELRTPLVGIVGYCDMLNSVNYDPDYRESLTAIKYCACQLLELANNMLDLAKIEARQLEVKLAEFDLHQLISHTVNTYYADGRTSVQLSADLSSDVPRFVLGDNTKIRQVILNLLTNAFKFTASGYVKVQMELDKAGDAPNGIYPVKITVIDSGTGINENERARIFEPFIHDVGTDAQGGTGLGLAICKQLVGIMGGRIWCEANPQGGAEFGFVLPLKAAEPLPEPEAVEKAGADLNGVKVLLAEDIIINRKLITLMLEKIGCEVVAVSNGEECIEALNEYNPDVILMDMQMPVMDGYNAASAIKQKPPAAAIPIVALTAYAMSGDVLKCQEAGCSYYLSKPFTMEQLTHILGECLGLNNNERLISGAAINIS